MLKLKWSVRMFQMETLAGRIERVPDKQFVKGETVYVIDTNKFDIYKATIEHVFQDGYEVNYTEYDQRDTIAMDEVDRLLPDTRKNRAEYERQDKIRLAREQENDDDDFIDDDEDDEDFDSDSDSKKKKKKKKQTKKKEKPKKEPKPKKEKKEKPKKEPKPKKEKKEKKESKEKKKEEKKKEEIRRKNSPTFKYIKEAYESNIRDEDSFLVWLDSQENKPEDLNFEKLAKSFVDYVAASAKLDSDYESSDYYSEDDAPKVFEEEVLHKPHKEPEVPIVDELRIPSWIGVESTMDRRTSRNTSNIMTIRFDHKNSNAFIYKTDDGKLYLILNGEAMELRTRASSQEEYLYRPIPVISNEDHTSKIAYVEAYKRNTLYQITEKPEDVRVLEELEKKNSRTKDSSVTVTKKKELTSNFLED